MMGKPGHADSYDALLDRHNKVTAPAGQSQQVLTYRQNAILLEILRTQMQILEELRRSKKEPINE